MTLIEDSLNGHGGNLQSDDTRRGDTKQTPVWKAADGKRWCLWGSVCNFGAMGMESYSYILNWAGPPPTRRSGTSSRPKSNVFLRWYRQRNRQEGLTWSGSCANLNPPSIWLCLPPDPNKHHKTKDPILCQPSSLFSDLSWNKKVWHSYRNYKFTLISKILFSNYNFVFVRKIFLK